MHTSVITLVSLWGKKKNQNKNRNTQRIRSTGSTLRCCFFFFAFQQTFTGYFQLTFMTDDVFIAREIDIDDYVASI